MSLLHLRDRCWVQVSLPTVRKFVKGLEEKALGAKVVKGAKPEQQLVKIVNDELIALMGGKQAELVVPKDGPQVCCLYKCCLLLRCRRASCKTFCMSLCEQTACRQG